MTKAELSQIYWLNKEIAMWQQKLDRLESQSLIKGQQITGMPAGGGRTTSKVEEQVMKREEIRENIQKLIARAAREEARLMEYLKGVEDTFVRQIIVYRFMDLMPWNKVAQKMGAGYTSDSVRMAVDRYLKK